MKMVFGTVYGKHILKYVYHVWKYRKENNKVTHAHCLPLFKRRDICG